MRPMIAAAAFLFLASSPAMAQFASSCTGSSTTCRLDYSSGTGKIALPAGSAAPIDCNVRFQGGATIAGGLIVAPGGAAVSFSVPALTSLPLERVIEADCQNTAGVGGKTTPTVTFPDGRVPAAPTLSS